MTRMRNLFHRRKGRVRLKSVSVNIPYVGGATFVPDEAETHAAWALYVELSTRVPVQRLDPRYGSVREALNSIYALFGETRAILREFGPRIAHGRDSLAHLALGVLNNGLRPFLTKWHSELHIYEAQCSPQNQPGQHERNWPMLGEFRSELEELKENLEAYRKALLTIAGAQMEDDNGG